MKSDEDLTSRGIKKFLQKFMESVDNMEFESGQSKSQYN